jgi:hypothetical protein
MTKEVHDLGEYEVTVWLRETGWPTKEYDIDEMIRIYHEWQLTVNMSDETGAYNEEVLIQMIFSRIRHLHPNPRDACVITAMLILHAAYLARAEHVFSPGLTDRLH